MPVMTRTLQKKKTGRTLRKIHKQQRLEHYYIQGKKRMNRRVIVEMIQKRMIQSDIATYFA